MRATRREPALPTDDLASLASRLGFSPVPCRSCTTGLDPRCGNCDGVGFLWSGRGATLSRDGLLRFADGLQAIPPGGRRPA